MRDESAAASPTCPGAALSFSRRRIDGAAWSPWRSAATTRLPEIPGTPRVNPDQIRAELVRAGKTEAAARDGRRADRSWDGVTEGGTTRKVEGRGYSDPDWHEAHRDLVAAGLRQGVGRGRPILSDGVPVVVLSKEALGFPLAHERVPLRIPSRINTSVLSAFTPKPPGQLPGIASEVNSQ